MSGGSFLILLGIGVFGLIAFLFGLAKIGLRNMGAVHSGEMKDGRRHGQGTLTWTDGTVYVGELKTVRYMGRVRLLGPMALLRKAPGKRENMHFRI